MNAAEHSKLRGASAAIVFLVASGLGWAKAQVSSPAPAREVSGGGAILVADLRNPTGNAALDVALHQAITSQLEQSPFFDVIPEGKMRAVLGKTAQPASESAALAACRRLNGQVMVAPTISSESGGYTVLLTARSCAVGTLLAQTRSDAGSAEEIVAKLTPAVSSLRAHLGEPAASIQRFEAPAALGSTSVAALDAYGRGLAEQREAGDVASAPLFRAAIAADPNFPMPYVSLSWSSRNLRQPRQALSYAEKAHELSGGVGERARLRIEAAYYSAIGDLTHEISVYRAWASAYPRDSTPHNNLGDNYFAVGDSEKALEEYQTGLRLSPTMAGYSNVMGAYLSLDRYREARQAYDDASAAGLDGRYVRQTMYWLAFVTHDPAQMDEQARWAAGKPGDEDVLLSLQSDTAAFHGHMAQARALTRQAVASAIGAKADESAALWQVNAALREAELGDQALAAQDAHAALRLSDGRDVELFATLALARSGRVAEARSHLAELERTYSTVTMMRLYWFPTLRAAIALSQGDSPAALKALAPSQPYELAGAGTTINYVYPAYLRGEAYLAEAKYRAAEIEFRKLVDHPGIVINFITGALVNARLGQTCAGSGDTKAAKGYYDAFFRQWADADPDLPFMKAVKAEYVALGKAISVRS